MTSMYSLGDLWVVLTNEEIIKEFVGYNKNVINLGRVGSGS